MYNWSTDEEAMKRDYPEKYRTWRILQLINYGLDGEKLDFKEIKALWPEINDQILGNSKKEYLKILLNIND